ncbi:hypothetical protein BUALT_Bualt08G0098300 [Buddleja alternifolia]|uniref:Uncharacterized protein n=1 Tax=Buddleja alternifolia TaxID=168488 RepID=A0AAV6XFY7_9LAMI|nr:hypothetical protein BUALT_Bualt08G0098300 [Buddleja alternifolia]
MANFHSRSNSFPSQSHPIVNDVEDHLRRLRASEATSTSATSICTNLASLKTLHEGINNMIEMPSIQQALSNKHGQSWINELLEGSLRLVDLCEFSREVACLTKETIQDLESSIRRNRGETATKDDIKAYVASRNKINKMVNKYIKNLKSFNQNSKSLPDVEFGMVLKETETIVFSVLRSALTLITGEKSKPKSWSIFSKFTQNSRVHSEKDDHASSNLCASMLYSFIVFRSATRQRYHSLKHISQSEMIQMKVVSMIGNIVSHSLLRKSFPLTMAASNDFSEKAASHKSQTNNAQIPQPQDNSSKVVPKLNPVHGKLTLSKNQLNCAVPKTFPPKNFNSSSRFPISRTWHRNSSVTATEPKVQPKTARTTNTSYIRKGNSLVRIGHVDDPALLGTKRVNESTHAMPINYREKSLNSIARALEETLKTSAVPECQVGTVSNSDRHRALEEQISGKKITYFKRSLYQLVAASDFEDLSVLGNTQASSSDGYYKKRKNQLVRLSLGNHIKEGANGNTYKLGSPAILLRSSNKRRSGFAKTYRFSKFSFVWKLHEAKSLGKPKN